MTTGLGTLVIPGQSHRASPGDTPGPAGYHRTKRRQGPRPWRRFREWVVLLLDGHRSAGALEGRLRLLRRFLVDLLKHGLRRAVHQVLGLLQAQAGQRAHLLDDLNLLVARGLEDDVELVLLLNLFRRRRASAAARCRDRDRGRSLDVERLLER